jgi:hypothetical protein
VLSQRLSKKELAPVPLRILFRILSFIALSLVSLVGLAVFDANCNSSKLLKNLLERALSRSHFHVTIEKVEPRYLARQLSVTNVEAFWQGRPIAKLKTAECAFSFRKVANVNVSIKADELVSCEFPLRLDAFEAKASFNPVTGYKDVLMSSANGVLAHAKFEGPSIFVSIEPLFSPNLIRSKCTAKLELNSQGKIKRICSSGALDELYLKLNNKHLSQISLSSITWNCNVDSGILSSIEKQDLEFKANFHKSGKYCFRLSGKLNAGDAVVLLDTASGDHQAFKLKAESSFLKGSGPIQGGLCSIVNHLTELGFLQSALIKDAKKDICDWNASFNFADGKFNIIISSDFDHCKLILGTKVMPVYATSARALLSNSNYQVSLDSIIDGGLFVKAEIEGDGSSTHLFQGSVRATKELSFPEPTLFLQPSVCRFAGSIEKKERLCFHLASDLSDFSFLFDKYGFIKTAGQPGELKLSGVFYGSACSVQGTFISGANSAISGSCFTDGNITQMDLDNVIYAKSHYSLKAESDQEHLKTEIAGSALDLSNANLSAWVVPKYHTKSKEIIAAFDNLYMKNDKAVSNIAMYSYYNGKHYTGCLFQGSLGSTGFINVTLDGSDSVNLSEGWVCRANNLGYVMQALGLYKGVKNGALDLVFDIDRINVTQASPAPLIHGNIRLQRFRVEKIPFFLWATCPSAIARLFVESKYSHFDSAYASFSIFGKELAIERGNVKSFSSDIVLYRSKISPNGILLRGGVAPSWYGLGNLVRWTPIVGDMLELIQLPGVWIPFVWKKEFN